MRYLILLTILLTIPFLLGATFSLTIPDNKVEDIKTAFCEAYGYDEEYGTKAQFTKDQIKRYIRDVYIAYKVDSTMESTRVDTIVQAESDTEGVTVE